MADNEELQAAVERVSWKLPYEPVFDPAFRCWVNAADLRLILAALEAREKALEEASAITLWMLDAFEPSCEAPPGCECDVCSTYRRVKDFRRALTALGGTADV